MHIIIVSRTTMVVVRKSFSYRWASPSSTSVTLNLRPLESNASLATVPVLVFVLKGILKMSQWAWNFDWSLLVGLIKPVCHFGGLIGRREALGKSYLLVSIVTNITSPLNGWLTYVSVTKWPVALLDKRHTLSKTRMDIQHPTRSGCNAYEDPPRDGQFVMVSSEVSSIENYDFTLMIEWP